MSDEILSHISRQLEQLIKLVASTTVKGMKQNEAIVVLGAAGLDRNTIAELLGTTPGTVSVRLSQVKAASKQPANKQPAKKKDQPVLAAASPISEEKA